MGIDPKKTQVEDLEHFPFKNFVEFRKALLAGMIKLAFNREDALYWAQEGVYTQALLRAQITFLIFLPFLAAIGFSIYAFISKNWLLLLALPLLIFGRILFFPGVMPVRVFVLLTILGFIWSFWVGKTGLLILTVALLSIWYFQKIIIANAVYALNTAAYEHEDLLCFLWKKNKANIHFSNGNTYRVKYKLEDGEYTNYD